VAESAATWNQRKRTELARSCLTRPGTPEHATQPQDPAAVGPHLGPNPRTQCPGGRAAVEPESGPIGPQLEGLPADSAGPRLAIVAVAGVTEKAAYSFHAGVRNRPHICEVGRIVGRGADAVDPKCRGPLAEARRRELESRRGGGSGEGPARPGFGGPRAGSGAAVERSEGETLE
jgi:hypothetical protein